VCNQPGKSTLATLLNGGIADNHHLGFGLEELQEFIGRASFTKCAKESMLPWEEASMKLFLKC